MKSASDRLINIMELDHQDKNTPMGDDHHGPDHETPHIVLGAVGGGRCAVRQRMRVAFSGPEWILRGHLRRFGIHQRDVAG